MAESIGKRDGQGEGRERIRDRLRKYLEIAMDDSLLVHVVDGLEDLSHQIGRILFRVRSFLHDTIEQFATCHSALINDG